MEIKTQCQILLKTEKATVKLVFEYTISVYECSQYINELMCTY